ncbi:hypothetical protein GCM10027258_41460 [Amycolatopsis stemonae]
MTALVGDNSAGKSVLWHSKLVIMDEPTAALGVQQTEVVLQLVGRLAERGLGVIVVSHNMNAGDLTKETVVDLMTAGRSDRWSGPGRMRGVAS